MAVYTHVSNEEIEAFVAEYDIGTVTACKGIAEGVENTNYLLQTDHGSFILTLYEKRVKEEELPFFLALMEHLAARGLSCPTPLHGRDGAALRTLCGRRAVIVTFLSGLSPQRITAEHCAALGQALAALHVAGLDFEGRRANALSLAGWQGLAARCAERADDVRPGLGEMIARELEVLGRGWPDSHLPPQGISALPVGIIHADLFPDNVFFQGLALTGLIDFYFACTDYLAYDIAICLNAWCFEPDHSFNATKALRLLQAYQAVRPLTEAEMTLLPLFARGSALRFLLTRLYDWLNHPEGALVRPKDPMEYVRKLRFHQHVTGPGDYGVG